MILKTTKQFFPGPIKKALAVLYFLVLGYLVFFARRRRHRIIRSVYLIPIKSTISQYREFVQFDPLKFYTDLFGNLLLFVPVAFVVRFLFPRTKNWQVILFGFLLSVSIEVLQYVFEVGYSEIDDVIVNTLGTILGLCLYKYSTSQIEKFN